jgi:hypothetical protein
MWKSHFTVVLKDFVFHRGCGKGCGNLEPSVENLFLTKVFHISTGQYRGVPVEMWKT